MEAASDAAPSTSEHFSSRFGIRSDVSELGALPPRSDGRGRRASSLSNILSIRSFWTREVVVDVCGDRDDVATTTHAKSEGPIASHPT